MLRREGFKEALGAISVENQRAKVTRYADGVVTGNTVWINATSKKWTVEQLAKHEAFHHQIQDWPYAMDAVRQALADELVLTATSAGKLSSPYTNDGRTMSDAAYELKGNAAAHIDELVSISNRKGTVKTDRAGRHGAMASDGWAYRTAYFEDFNGKYYQLTISAARNASGSMVYNIGNMKEEASPKVKGSSAGNGNDPRGFASSDTSIRSAEQKSQEKFSADSSTATPQENDKAAPAAWEKRVSAARAPMWRSFRTN